MLLYPVKHINTIALGCFFPIIPYSLGDLDLKQAPFPKFQKLVIQFLKFSEIMTRHTVTDAVFLARFANRHAIFDVIVERQVTMPVFFEKIHVPTVVWAVLDAFCTPVGTL